MEAHSDSKLRLLIRNIISVGAVQVANYLLPLISIPIIVRIVGPTNFGSINYYSSFVAYFILLINYGFDYTGTRFIAANKDDVSLRNKRFSLIISAKALLFFISLLIFTVCLFIIPKNTNEIKVAIYTFLICISWIISPNWFFQGMQQLRNVAIFNLTSKVIYTIIILVIIKNKSDYLLQPLILSITQIMISCISLFVAVRKYNIKLISVKIYDVLQLLYTERMIFFSMLATNLYTDTNIVILGFFEPKDHIGYFTAAWKFIFIFLMLISFPFSQALFPFIGEAFSIDKNKGIEQIKRILPIVIYFTLIASFVVYLLGDVLIISFYGKQFAPAVIIFKILTLVPVLSFLNTILGLQTMVNLKMDKPFFVITFLGGIFSVIFNIVVIKFFGYVGSAWSWIITEIIIATLLYRYLKSNQIVLFEAKYFNVLNIVKELNMIRKR